jgi:hypothetical protein
MRGRQQILSATAPPAEILDALAANPNVARKPGPTLTRSASGLLGTTSVI